LLTGANVLTFDVKRVVVVPLLVPEKVRLEELVRTGCRVLQTILNAVRTRVTSSTLRLRSLRGTALLDQQTTQPTFH
jgi:hypothetical protein